MRILSGVILALIVLAMGVAAFIYSGMYNVAASDEHSALVRWAMHTTMENSIKARAEGVNVPDMAGNDMIQQGARAYDSLCAACHLKPGMQDTVLRAGLNPMPPALADQARWGPAEQFWIVKHGIKMTGMPAWGETHEDQELWEMVAFLQRLPELSGQEYTALVNSDDSSSGERVGEEHVQDDGHDHDHGDMSAMMGSPESGTSKEEPGDESTPAAEDDAEADNHYADGHTH